MVYIRNRAHQPTDIAHMDPVRIRDFKQTLLEESRRTVRNHTIALHLSETETAVTRTTLDRLSGEDLGRSTCACVNLVIDHMPQTLVVCWTQEDLGSHLPTCVAIVHDLETALLEIGLLQKIGDVVDGDTTEGSRIAFLRVDRANLGQQTLDQMGNSHTRRNSVRVDDKIRRQPISSERHILVTVRDTNGTFLTVTGGKLVTDLWHLGSTRTDFDEPQTFGVRRE